MTSPAKLGKYVEGSRSRGCFDRISGLPDELLAQILSSLPTRCVVSTSILSKRWRYLFTLTDSLSFDDAPCFAGSKDGNKDSKVARKQRFKEFVYNVLKMHRISPIQKFSLVCCGRYDNSDLNAWVSEAVQKGVVEIYYKVPRQKGTLPDALVRCETLGRLEIVCGDNEIEIPSLAWLPNLKILHLKDVIINDYDSVKNLFSSCKLLEELNLQSFQSDTHCHVIISTELLKVLTIKDCIFDEGLLEIDAPNLAYLTYDSNIGVKVVPSWKNSDSLVNTELTFKLSSEDDNFRFTSLLYRQLLKAAAYKVTRLNLLFDSVEPLLTLADREEMPDFHSLLTLRLHYCPYYAWPYFTRLLDKSPLLETVILERGLHRCHCDPVTIPDMPLIPFLSQVKVVILHSFCTHERARLLLAHLLRNARVLKRLILFSSCRVGTQEELQLRGDLLSLPRASADCSIELTNHYSIKRSCKFSIPDRLTVIKG